MTPLIADLVQATPSAAAELLQWGVGGGLAFMALVVLREGMGLLKQRYGGAGMTKAEVYDANARAIREHVLPILNAQTAILNQQAQLLTRIETILDERGNG